MEVIAKFGTPLEKDLMALYDQVITLWRNAIAKATEIYSVPISSLSSGSRMGYDYMLEIDNAHPCERVDKSQLTPWAVIGKDGTDLSINRLNKKGREILQEWYASPYATGICPFRLKKYGIITNRSYVDTPLRLTNKRWSSGWSIDFSEENGFTFRAKEICFQHLTPVAREMIAHMERTELK